MLRSTRSVRLGLGNEEFRAATRCIVTLSIVFVAVRSHAADHPTRPGGNQSFAPGDAVTVAGPRCDLERLYVEAERVVEFAIG
ncbi:MAG: hypothetical protein ABI614_14125 [Planctomycetota bacterium]